MSKTIIDKINGGREFRSMVMECRALSTEAESKIVEGYATTFDEEYKLGSIGDIDIFECVDSRAFENCDLSDVIFQYDHEGRVFARKSNGTLRLEVDEHGLKVFVDLSGTEEGRKLYEEIRGGYTTKMSFGFTVRKDEQTESKGEDGRWKIRRRITDIEKLYDVSAVSLPANDGTSISARSWCNGAVARLEAERLKNEAERKLKVKAEERSRALSILEVETL